MRPKRLPPPAVLCAVMLGACVAAGVVEVATATGAVRSTPLLARAGEVLVDTVVDLSGPWHYRLEKPGDTGLASPKLSHAGWPTTNVPGRLHIDEKKGVVWLRRFFELPPGTTDLALRIGVLAGEVSVFVNGVDTGVDPSRFGPILIRKAPALRPGRNVVAVRLAFRGGKRGMWWAGGPPALGTLGSSGLLGFSVANVGSGPVAIRDHAKEDMPDYGLYLPPGAVATADVVRSAYLPLVIALHGWGGNIYNLLPYGILAEADRLGAVVAFPYGAKTLYVDDAEQLVLRVIDDVASRLPIDRSRIGLLGVSMGGAGALGVGFHYPDRFSAIVSYFGDSFYDLKRYPYLRRVLKKKIEVDRASALRVPENVRHLPVFLVHGRADRVVDVNQSEELHKALRRLGFSSRFEDPPDAGHTVRLVNRFLPEAMAFLVAARRVDRPTRVSYGKNDDRYPGAWWLRFPVRKLGKFGHVDVAADPATGTLTIHRADGVTELTVQLDELPPSASGWGKLVWSKKRRLRVRFEGAAIRIGALPTVTAIGKCPAAEVRAESDGLLAVSLPAASCAVRIDPPLQSRD